MLDQCKGAPEEGQSSKRAPERCGAVGSQGRAASPSVQCIEESACARRSVRARRSVPPPPRPAPYQAMCFVCLMLALVYSVGVNQGRGTCIHHCKVPWAPLLIPPSPLTPGNHWSSSCLLSFAFPRRSQSGEYTGCSLFRLSSVV